MKKLLLFFVLLSNIAFGQLTAYQSGLYYRQQVRLPLEMGDVVAFPLAEARWQGAINMLVTPTSYYKDGKTHNVSQNPVDCSMNILTYDERYGVSRPIRYRRAYDECDSHHRPAIIDVNDTLRIITEVQHNEEPLVVFRARQSNDEHTFQVTSPVTEIGSGPSPDYPAYPTFFKDDDDDFLTFSQVNDIESAYNKNTSGNFEGTANWSSNIQMTTRAGNEDEHYNAAIMNKNPETTQRIGIVVNGRNDDLQPARWFNKYLLFVDITPSGQTYSNFDGSFTKTSQLTSSELITNFRYYTTGTDTAQGHIPVPMFDDENNFHDVTFDGDGDYVYIFKPAGSSAGSQVNTTINFPGSPDLQTYWEAGGSVQSGQNGAVVSAIAISRTDVRVYARILVGGWNKIYEYRTRDQGATWEDLGDTLPGVNAHIGSMIFPYNYGEIPNNRNFVITFIEVQNADTRCGVWMRKAAFGNIQSDDGNPYDDVTAYTESEFNNKMARSYMIEAGKVSLTGTTCNTIIDQSPSGENVTTVGSPVVDNATTPIYLQFDGTNDRGPIPINGLTTASEGMIFIVAKGVDATNTNFLTASNNTTTTDFLLFGKNAADRTKFIDSNTADIQGHTDVSDDYHIFVYLFQNGDGVGESDVLQFLDGALQKREVNTGNAVEGGFLDTMGAGLTHLSIGALVRTTTAFSNCRIKQVAIATTPFSTEELRRSIKYLATKHGITLNSGYQ